MNGFIGKSSAWVTGLAVAAFGISMLVGFAVPTLFFSCFASMLIAIGFVSMMIALHSQNRDPAVRAAGLSGMAFAGIYAVLILLVYYAECTTVRMNPTLSDETLSLISYGHIGSLFFNYDLLGYGFMGLSTFLVGFTILPRNRAARALRMLLWLHGIFFPICLLMPMFPVFQASGDTLSSVILLEGWCAYFIPVCVLAYRYCSAPEPAAAS